MLLVPKVIDHSETFLNADDPLTLSLCCLEEGLLGWTRRFEYEGTSQFQRAEESTELRNMASFLTSWALDRSVFNSFGHWQLRY